MKNLERSPSHSWWWDSHNSPKHSRWLQSNLQDLDEKVKEMLKLIEEDADSFAQRAEMYYQKRPELINLVEEFYRAYRSLAERYDHLTGEIRHNVPRALQVQYGLSCDSPQGSAVRRQLHSPLRKDNQTFESLLKKAGQSEVQVQVQCETAGVGTDACYEHRENGFSPDEGLTSSSDSEVDNSFAVQKLQQELKSLEHEKTLHQKTVERNEMLQMRIKGLEADNASLQEEAITLRSKVNELSKDVSNLQMENASQTDELSSRKLLAKRERVAFSHEHNNGVIQETDSERIEGSIHLETDLHMVNGECRKFSGSSLQEEYRNLDERLKQFTEENQRSGDVVKSAAEFQKTAALVSDLERNNKNLRGDLPANYAEETLKEPAIKLLVLKGENVGLGDESDNFQSRDEQRVLSLKQKLEDLQGQLTLLVEENRIQKLAILDRAEEKREAIRQLCFSMDILKSKSQRLEFALGFFKKKLSKPHNAVSAGNLPAWKKVLLGAWKGSKTQPYALAL